MESMFFKVGVQQVFLQLIQHLLNDFYVFFPLVFSSNKNIVKVHNNIDIELFCQNHIKIVLKYS